MHQRHCIFEHCDLLACNFPHDTFCRLSSILQLHLRMLFLMRWLRTYACMRLLRGNGTVNRAQSKLKSQGDDYPPPSFFNVPDVDFESHCLPRRSPKKINNSYAASSSSGPTMRVGFRAHLWPLSTLRLGTRTHAGNCTPLAYCGDQNSLAVVVAGHSLAVVALVGI